MNHYIEMAITVFVAVMASSGFWTYLQFRRDKKDAKTKMILGLGYDRIVTLCGFYITRGYITQSEYEDLYKYLYKPYKDMGGDGSAEKAFEEVKKLPMTPKEIKDEHYKPNV